MKKLLGILLVIMLVLSMSSVELFAAEATIVKELKGSEGSAHGEAYTKNETDGTLKTTEEYNGHVFNYNADLVGFEGKIVKTAFYATIHDVTNDSGSLKVNPAIKGQDPWLEGSADLPYDALSDYIGKKVLIVGAFTVEEGYNSVEARLWVTSGLVMTVHKVVIAPNEYNFANDAEYELIFEETDPNDSNAIENMIVSEKTEPQTSPEPTQTTEPTEPTKTPGDVENSKTADADLFVTCTAMVVSGLYSIKLRKKFIKK